MALKHLAAWLSAGLGVLLVLASAAAGWFLMWQNTLKNMGFFREVLGLNRCGAGLGACPQKRHCLVWESAAAGAGSSDAEPRPRTQAARGPEQAGGSSRD